jgi:hypothetical protein
VCVRARACASGRALRPEEVGKAGARGEGSTGTGDYRWQILAGSARAGVGAASRRAGHMDFLCRAHTFPVLRLRSASWPAWPVLWEGTDVRAFQGCAAAPTGARQRAISAVGQISRPMVFFRAHQFFSC